jgi:Concanavalin A-like lectin/glucanases superfamily
MTNTYARRWEDMKNNVSNRVSNNYKYLSNRFANNYNNISNRVSSNYNDRVDNSYDRNSTMQNASGDFLRSNNIVAKFSFLFLILILFVFILNLGINIVGYFMKYSNTYVIKGALDGKNPVVITQNPLDANSVSINRSNNANSGIEFTWSIWLLLKNNTSDKKYKNIFNKGDSFYNHTGISLVNNSPGLYLSSLVNNQNILHVIMDTVNPSDGPSIIDIDGLPFNKWFHVAIRIQNKVLDVYINGTIANRHVMKFVPKQNYNDVNVCQNGGFDGQLSNLQYYTHALSSPEINAQVVSGPNLKSSELNSTTHSAPYFLSNAWYTSQQ